MIVVHCIYFVAKLLNTVSASLVILEKFSPAKIILGQKIDAKKDLKVRFKAYVEASRDSIITNDMLDRTHP